MKPYQQQQVQDSTIIIIIMPAKPIKKILMLSTNKENHTYLVMGNSNTDMHHPFTIIIAIIRIKISSKMLTLSQVIKFIHLMNTLQLSTNSHTTTTNKINISN